MQHTALTSLAAVARATAFGIAIVAWAPLAIAAPKPAPPPPPPAAVVEPAPPPAPKDVLDRIRMSGKLVLGYRADARPLSYKDESGHAAGYAVTLCQKVADGMQSSLGVASLTVEWVADASLSDVQQGNVDLLCGGNTVTLTDRAVVSFSIPVFPGGVAALLRTDAPEQFRDALEELPPPYQPLWRGSTPQSIQALQRKTVSVVGGTPVVELLVARMAALKINSTVAPVDSYATGVASVVDRKSDMLVGDRAILLDLAKRDAQAKELRVLKRHFTYEPVALALRRDDDAFRLAVDRSLSAVYAMPAFLDIYAVSFGPADADTIQFFRMTTVPK